MIIRNIKKFPINAMQQAATIKKYLFDNKIKGCVMVEVLKNGKARNIQVRNLKDETGKYLSNDQEDKLKTELEGLEC